jgi:hypothetical protein
MGWDGMGGLNMDYPWIIHVLLMDYPWIVHGLPKSSQAKLSKHPGRGLQELLMGKTLHSQPALLLWLPFYKGDEPPRWQQCDDLFFI